MVTENQVQMTAAKSSPAERKVSRIALLGQLLKLSHLVMRPFSFVLSDMYLINTNELRVLMILAPMGEAASHEIAKATGMHPMNVSRAVATLSRAGRITSRRGDDGRRKILSLTPEGRLLYEKLLPQVRHMADLLFESMSPLETDFFAQLMAKLVDHMDEVVLEDRTMIGPIALADEQVDARTVVAEKPRRRSRRNAE